MESDNSQLKERSLMSQITIATYNVARMQFKDRNSIIQLLMENHIDVCAFQEVPGQKALDNLLQGTEYSGCFDQLYYTYGNALVYRKDKFRKTAHQLHLLKDGTSKKGLLSVDLQVIESLIYFRVYVTHLDHKTEPQRLREAKVLLNIIESSSTGSTPFVLCGDFNCLKRSDYTENEWKAISDVRMTSKWEPPQTEIVSLFESRGLIDYLSLFGKPEPTSRFNTRIDYIWGSRSEIVDNAKVINSLFNQSDHKPVVCTLTLA